MTKIITSAYIMIGDEILSGRTKDENLNFLAKNLANVGINLKEVRVIPDDEVEIIKAIQDLKDKYNYIFTTGGIGPTHDDITAESVAKALNDKVILNQEAKQILIDYYGQNNVNEARLKMAALPSKAILLNNSITSAPGFMVENIIVMAGVPEIMRSMFNSSLEFLDFGDKILSKELKLNITEGFIAKDLSKLQHEFPDVAIGSYPFAGGTSIVFRSFFEETLNKCHDIMSKKRYE
ncbi:MAG: molybdenum cofactor synthesis domain-containing protein [Rickettsiales bacterium]|jgi:molybdenum cofactor synthesis domain-containing protein